MLNLLRYLQSEHDLKENKKYSEPQIYDADGDLAKRWYVYFSYRKTNEDILERYPNNIYAPQHLGKKERIDWLKTIQRNLSNLLKDGFNPYNPDDRFNIANEEATAMSISDAFEFALNINTSLSETSFKALEGRI